MANLTVARPDVFPDGTSVSARVAQLQRHPLPGESDAPVGTAAATATVSSGTASLTGLADGTKYEIAGQVGGKWRRVYMSTPETTTGLAAVQAAAQTPNGLPHPALRKARRAKGLV